MSDSLSSRSMEVVALGNGRFGICIIGPDTLSRTVGNFETREEADAWLLQQSLLGDEESADHGVLKPGPSLDVS
jgi:hypothetical protein